MEGVWETLQVALRIRGGQPRLHDSTQALAWHVCSSTPHGRRRPVVLQLGRWGGMQAETVLNQEAQAHAAGCALVARLLGPVTPACI